MERPADRLRLDDADSYLRAQQGKLVVIDEIHRVPHLFEILRGIVDDWRAAGLRHGHFLLLGSAALDLMQQASETLAGRVAYIDVPAITAMDLRDSLHPDLNHEVLWLRGGFPDSLLADSDAASLNWRRDFVRSYLERDIPMFAPRLPAVSIGRLWTMLAHSQGEMLTQSRLAQALGVSAPAVGRYIDLLVQLQLVRLLPPWHCNVGKRLVKTPKTYVRDSGLVHALLELQDLHDVLGHPVAGHSYEGMALETLIAAVGSRYGAYFYRTQDGSEIDLVLSIGNRPEIGIEVKRSSAPSPQKGFAIACDDLAITRRFVVYPGTERFPLRHGAEAIGLSAMVQLLMGG
jgi:predicted AAA+ superfamily ATPase